MSGFYINCINYYLFKLKQVVYCKKMNINSSGFINFASIE